MNEGVEVLHGPGSAAQPPHKRSRKQAGEGKSYWEARKAKLDKQRPEAESDVLRGVAVYFEGFTDDVTSFQLKKLVYTHGGDVCHYFSKSRTTHVVCTNLCDSKAQRMGQSKRGVRVVHPDWLQLSCREGKKLPEEKFLIVKDHTMKSIDSFFRRVEPPPKRRKVQFPISLDVVWSVTTQAPLHSLDRKQSEGDKGAKQATSLVATETHALQEEEERLNDQQEKEEKEVQMDDEPGGEEPEATDTKNKHKERKRRKPPQQTQPSETQNPRAKSRKSAPGVLASASLSPASSSSSTTTTTLSRSASSVRPTPSLDVPPAPGAATALYTPPSTHSSPPPLPQDQAIALPVSNPSSPGLVRAAAILPLQATTLSPSPRPRPAALSPVAPPPLETPVSPPVPPPTLPSHPATPPPAKPQKPRKPVDRTSLHRFSPNKSFVDQFPSAHTLPFE